MIPANKSFLMEKKIKKARMSAAHIFFCIASLLLTESQKTYILLFIETKQAQAAALQTLHLTGGTYGHKENPLQNLLERR